MLQNLLVNLLDTGDCEEEEEKEEKIRPSLTLTISVKAMANYDLIIIVMKPIRG